MSRVDADALAGLRAGVALEVEVIEDEWNFYLAREVGQKEGNALEHSHQHYRAPAIVTGDLPRERAYASLELERGDDDGADVLLAKVLDLDGSVAGFGQELLIVLAIKQPHVYVGVKLAQQPHLAVLWRHQRLLHRGELDVKVVFGQVEVRREHLGDPLALPRDRERDRLVDPANPVVVEEAREFLL